MISVFKAEEIPPKPEPTTIADLLITNYFILSEILFNVLLITNLTILLILSSFFESSIAFLATLSK